MKPKKLCNWILVATLFSLSACGEARDPAPNPEEVGQTEAALSYGNHGFAWVALDTASSVWKVQNNFSWSSGSTPFPSVTRDATGRYTVTFAGLNAGYTGPGRGGNVQVVATNQSGTGSIFANTRCEVAGWGTPPTQAVSVACHNTSGALADSPFIVHYFQADAATLGKSGYLRTTGDPSSDAPYNPTGTFSGNTTGGLNTVDRTAVGLYTVTLGGLAAPLCGVYPPCYGGNAQVTAYGDSGSYCKISSYSPSGADETVNVRCYGAAGLLADSHFSLNFDHRPSSPYGIGAHALANDATLASYTPDPAYSYNSDPGLFGTGTNQALRQTKGVYQMRHFGLSNNKGAPLVTAFGTDNLHCKIEKWGFIPGTVRDVQVETRCWAPTGGAPQDSQYAEMFVSRRKPDFSDGDGDGFGPNAGDCDDANAAVHPGAAELCNGVDDDCDTAIDEGGNCGVTAIAGGDMHRCALLATGQVKCWGYGGLLGIGDGAGRGDNAGEMGDNLPFVDLGTGRTATAITVGGIHACALLDNGQVKCWGSNYAGALGLGDTLDRGGSPGQMGDNLPAVDLGSGRTAVAIASGSYRSCALLDNGQIKCWGYNALGQLGLGNTIDRGDNPGEMGNNLPAVNLGTGRTAVAFAGGSNHTCAILDNQQLKCWGWGGALGIEISESVNKGDNPNEMGDNLPPVNLGTGRFAIAIRAQGHHACAVLDNGQTKCWGANFEGELGLGDTAWRGISIGSMGDNLPPIDFGSGRTVLDLSAGFSHNCVLLDNFAVKCWGRNVDGTLGLGDTITRGDNSGEMGDALPAVSLGTGRSAQLIGAGKDSTCVELDSHVVKCWGMNFDGELGLGDTANRGDDPGEMGDNLPPTDL